jgi:hypothetical protein
MFHQKSGFFHKRSHIFTEKTQIGHFKLKLLSMESSMLASLALVYNVNAQNWKFSGNAGTEIQLLFL